MLPSRLNRSSPPLPSERNIEELDRHLALEASVAALRQPHAAHSALANLRDQRVRAEGLARESRLHGSAEPGLLRENLLCASTRCSSSSVCKWPASAGFCSPSERQPGRALLFRHGQRLIQVRTYRTATDRGLVWTSIPQSDKSARILSMEINARLLPVPLHRTFRYVPHGGDFGEREAAEELQVDEFGEEAAPPWQARPSTSLIRASSRWSSGILHGFGAERSNLELAHHASGHAGSRA